LTTIYTLASGSSGNAALISRGDTHVLLDAGISCRRITASLQELGLAPADLSAIFITHTHSDHISGLNTIVKKWDVPICASMQTCDGLESRIAGISRSLRPFRWGESLSWGKMTITPFPTSHDAPGSADYRFDDLGVLTDTGYVTAEAADVLAGVRLLMLETNHDVETLRSGPYPYYLKQRILGTAGHLSNETAAAFAAQEVRLGAQELILAHLSEENNTPAMARRAVETALTGAGLSSRVSVAPRSELSRGFGLEDALCSE
jgi:phosphoribosyl 1,2-cyclic phosphodiesterase